MPSQQKALTALQTAVAAQAAANQAARDAAAKAAAAKAAEQTTPAPSETTTQGG